MCTICKVYLLEGEVTGTELRLGERAHIVGQGSGGTTPRGDVPMSREDVNLAAVARSALAKMAVWLDEVAAPLLSVDICDIDDFAYWLRRDGGQPEILVVARR